MQTLEIKHQGQVAWIWMNRPDVHNAFNAQMIEDLTAAVSYLNQNDEVRVIVLAGHGKSFSAGADLTWMKEAAGYSYDENVADASKLANMLHTIATSAKPVIARVHGAAFGGGVGLTAAADIAIASMRAKFCLSEVRLGLTPATISPYVLQAMGARAARRYFLSAEQFDSPTAARYDLIHQVCADEESLDEAIQDLCEKLCLGAPGAQFDCKKLITDFSHGEITEATQLETAKRIADRRGDPEGQEGLSAFLTKKTPAWQQPKSNIAGDS